MLDHLTVMACGLRQVQVFKASPLEMRSSRRIIGRYDATVDYWDSE